MDTKTVYNPKKSIEKGQVTAAQTGLGGSVATIALAIAMIAKGGSVEDAVATGVVGAVVTVGGAILSGFHEWRRNRKKHKKPKKSRKMPDVYGILILGGLAAFALAGCAKTTTTLPDGTVVVEPNPAADRARLETLYIGAVQGFDLWQAIQAELEDRDEAEYERELARRQARIDELRRVFQENKWSLPLVERNTGLELSQ